MAHKVTTHTDDDTGRTTRWISIDCRLQLAGEVATIAREHVAHTIGVRRLEDFADLEHALRTGAWQPKNAAVLVSEMDRLSVLWSMPVPPVKTIAFLGIRLGMLLEEADAQERWPLMAEGRQHRVYRTKQRARAVAGVKAKAENATRQQQRLRAAAFADLSKHPGDSRRKMARRLHAQFPDQSPDALRLAIARLLK